MNHQDYVMLESSVSLEINLNLILNLFVNTEIAVKRVVVVAGDALCFGCHGMISFWDIKFNLSPIIM